MARPGVERTRLAASAVGGDGITRRVGERMAYVEFANNGPACALFSDDQSEGETMQVGLDAAGFARLLDRMDAYLHG